MAEHRYIVLARNTKGKEMMSGQFSTHAAARNSVARIKQGFPKWTFEILDREKGKVDA